MTAKKNEKTVQELEAKEESEIIEVLITNEKLALYDEYFSAGLDAAGLVYPKNHYDFIVFNAGDHHKYYYGTAGAHALDALKDGGYFVFNHNGSAHDMDQVIHILEFVGLTYVENQSKNGFYMFQKVV